MIIFTVIVFSLSLISLSLSIPVERIVNGTDAVLGEVPYIVSLQVNSEHSCGGSIINERCILTAAHCVNGGNANSLSVKYGEVTLNRNSDNLINVESYIKHEKYMALFGYTNDLAVLKLSSPIRFSDTVQPIKLPFQTETFADWTEAILSGWGYSYSGGTIMNNLQRVNLFLYPDSECEGIHKYANSNYHVCAGVPEGGKGQCSGDSGGPLTINGIQVGIVSWSVKPCASKGYPGVFARVANYVDWITDKCNS